MKSFDPVESLSEIRHEFGEHGGVNMSIEASSTFTVMDAETMPALFQGQRGTRDGCYLYGRHFNPTVYHLARQMAALEGTEAAYCTASGMAAISAIVLQHCNQGDHIVASNTLYGGTYALMKEYLPLKCGIKTTFVDASNPDEVRAALRDNTRLVYAESLSNPTLRVANINALATIAHEADAKLVIDNTFSPLLISPAQLGADVVVHSLTKFINGASDIIAGAVCGSGELINELMDLHTGSLMLLGPTMDPKVASDISLRIPHLPLRMIAHGERAAYLAERLERDGYPVNYPGLRSHPDHDLMNQQRVPGYGYGGILSLDLGTRERANRLIEDLQNRHRFGYMAVSLGYADTLMSCSGASTSSEMSDEDQRAAGISPGLVRFSIGFTGTAESRWAQLKDSLERLDQAA